MKRSKKLFGLAVVMSIVFGLSGCKKDPVITYEQDKTYHYTITDGVKDEHTKAKHVFEEDAKKYVAPTCSTKGKKVEVCTVCKFEKETDVKEIDHTYVEDTAKAVAAACETAGSKYEKCSVCGAEKTTPIVATGHTITATDTGKAGVKSIVCSKCNYQAYEFDISQATGWNKATTKWNAKTTDASNNAVEASWDVSGIIPNGNYKIELEGLMSYTSHGNRYFYNQWETDTDSSPDKENESPFRYFFKVNSGEAINPDTTKSWAELGYEGSNDSGTPKYAEVVSTVAINDATTFSVFHGDIGYSMIVSRIKLVKIA